MPFNSIQADEFLRPKFDPEILIPVLTEQF